MLRQILPFLRDSASWYKLAKRALGICEEGVSVITCIIRMEDYGYGITKGSI